MPAATPGLMTPGDDLLAVGSPRPTDDVLPISERDLARRSDPDGYDLEMIGIRGPDADPRAVRREGARVSIAQPHGGTPVDLSDIDAANGAPPATGLLLEHDAAPVRTDAGEKRPVEPGEVPLALAP